MDPLLAQRLIDLSFALINSTYFKTENRETDPRQTASIHRPNYDALFDFLHKECPKPEKKLHLLIVEGDTEPRIEGPFASESEKEEFATQHRKNDPEQRDGIFSLDVWGTAKVDSFSGAFFEDEEDED